ncbi:bifunctional nuclease family protein [Candidatus Jorgensenbacteria bacterium]|nr:bifunctional nuclease family protein [Candidatus Jorgensenbacteria bacterium]
MQRIRMRVVAVGIKGTESVLILREEGGERYLPIFIDPFTAQAITRHMGGIKSNRPLTHDLMKTLIEFLGSRLAEVTVTKIENETFYAVLSIEGREIDARPSDAITLALKCNVPIYAAREVVDEGSCTLDEMKSGYPATERKGDPQEKTKQPQRKTEIVRKTKEPQSLESLKKQLDSAIKREDYEKAAELRDEIKQLEDKD